MSCCLQLIFATCFLPRGVVAKWWLPNPVVSIALRQVRLELRKFVLPEAKHVAVIITRTAGN